MVIRLGNRSHRFGYPTFSSTFVKNLTLRSTLKSSKSDRDSTRDSTRLGGRDFTPSPNWWTLKVKYLILELTVHMDHIMKATPQNTKRVWLFFIFFCFFFHRSALLKGLFFFSQGGSRNYGNYYPVSFNFFCSQNCVCVFLCMFLLFLYIIFSIF